MTSVLLAPGLFFSDRKSTRLNSSHLGISHAAFCLKKIARRGCSERRVPVGEGSFWRCWATPGGQTHRGLGGIGACMDNLRRRLAGDGPFFNDTATPEIYTLSLLGALPI